MVVVVVMNGLDVAKVYRKQEECTNWVIVHVLMLIHMCVGIVLYSVSRLFIDGDDTIIMPLL